MPRLYSILDESSCYQAIVNGNWASATLAKAMVRIALKTELVRQVTNAEIKNVQWDVHIYKNVLIDLTYKNMQRIHVLLMAL